LEEQHPFPELSHLWSLLHREKQGTGKIGWESLLIIVFYLAGNLWLFVA
jgi:hypothetical protein